MTTQWDRFSARAGQTIRDLGGEEAIELTNGTGGYQGPGDSGNVSFPTTPDATLDAETAAPSAVSGIEDAGTFEGVQQIAWIEDRPPIEIIPYGHPDKPPTRVTALENDVDYEVRERVPMGDGYVMLQLTEL